jgi:uncharacterized membrane protein YfcA
LSAGVALGGLLVGALVGLTGVGGGSLVTPALVWLGVPVPTAVGTDLVANAVTKLVGAVQHARQGSVDARWVLALAVPGIPGAVGGSLLVGALRQHPGAQPWLLHLLGGALVLAAGATLLHGRARRGGPNGGEGRPPRCVAAVGALVGLLLGLTSVGGGSLVAPVLLLTSRLTPRQVVGTETTSALLLAVCAGAAHLAVGTVDVRLVLNLLAGSVPGVWLGSRLTLRVPGHHLRAAVSGLVFVTGVRWLA